MEVVSCVICLEEGVVRGFICGCRKGTPKGESVCVNCELSIENAKCPLCRKDYPPVFVRYALSECKEKYEDRFREMAAAENKVSQLGDVFFRIMLKNRFELRLANLIFGLIEDKTILQRSILNSIEDYVFVELLNSRDPNVELIEAAADIYDWIVKYGAVDIVSRIDDIIQDTVEMRSSLTRERQKHLTSKYPTYAPRFFRRNLKTKHR
jgi:hypothetical protein